MSTALGRSTALRFLYDGFNEDDMVILPDGYEKTVEEALKKIPGKEPVYLVEEIPYYKK